jgi:hypothetical protein
MSQEQLGEAIREEKALNVCARHPRTVYFDGPVCPCCKLEKEQNKCACLQTRSNSQAK